MPRKPTGRPPGRRPILADGEAHEVYLDRGAWQHCLAQPGGASPYIRGLIERDRQREVLRLSETERRTLLQALETALRPPDTGVREADVLARIIEQVRTWPNVEIANDSPRLR